MCKSTLIRECTADHATGLATIDFSFLLHGGPRVNLKPGLTDYQRLFAKLSSNLFIRPATDSEELQTNFLSKRKLENSFPITARGVRLKSNSFRNRFVEVDHLIPS